MSKTKRPPRAKESTKRIRKKTSVLTQERVAYVDYKDVNLLSRFLSDRSKIRSRRVNGNDVQQQNEIAKAIKNAREMALLPYTKRVASQRTPRADRDSSRDTSAEVESQVDDEVLDTDVDGDNGDDGEEA